MYIPPTRNINVVFPPAYIRLRVSLYLASELHRLLLQDNLIDGPPEEGRSLCRTGTEDRNRCFKCNTVGQFQCGNIKCMYLSTHFIFTQRNLIITPL